MHLNVKRWQQRSRMTIDNQQAIKRSWPLLSSLLFLMVGPLFSAQASGLEPYTWSNRLVIMITDDKQSDLKATVNRFFEAESCAIDARNLLLLAFEKNQKEVDSLPTQMHGRTGLWLVGYDSRVKDYSADSRLLDRLYATIDSMPMRKQEMAENATNC